MRVGIYFLEQFVGECKRPPPGGWRADAARRDTCPLIAMQQLCAVAHITGTSAALVATSQAGRQEPVVFFFNDRVALASQCFKLKAIDNGDVTA